MKGNTTTKGDNRIKTNVDVGQNTTIDLYQEVPYCSK